MQLNWTMPADRDELEEGTHNFQVGEFFTAKGSLGIPLTELESLETVIAWCNLGSDSLREQKRAEDLQRSLFIACGLKGKVEDSRDFVGKIVSATVARADNGQWRVHAIAPQQS